MGTMTSSTLTYPGGKRFAFSVFDDPDGASLEAVRPIYDYLSELGIFTTKSVWGLDCAGESGCRGSYTLENEDCADYVRELRRQGFEIGWHGACPESATRAGTQKALAHFEQIIGALPAIYAAHDTNRDNLYWGADRFAFTGTRWLYRQLKREPRGWFQGHKPGSEFFWGDLAETCLNYSRSFAFATTNLLNLRLPLVYRRPDAFYVKRWFLTCGADDVQTFNTAIRDAHQREWEGQGGLCVISTHFGKGFVVDGRIHPVTKALLKKLSDRNGWFAPVSQLLDLYVAQRGCPDLSGLKLLSLELKWFTQRLKHLLHSKQL